MEITRFLRICAMSLLLSSCNLFSVVEEFASPKSSECPECPECPEVMQIALPTDLTGPYLAAEIKRRWEVAENPVKIHWTTVHNIGDDFFIESGVRLAAIDHTTGKLIPPFSDGDCEVILEYVYEKEAFFRDGKKVDIFPLHKWATIPSSAHFALAQHDEFGGLEELGEWTSYDDGIHFGVPSKVLEEWVIPEEKAKVNIEAYPQTKQ